MAGPAVQPIGYSVEKLYGVQVAAHQAKPASGVGVGVAGGGVGVGLGVGEGIGVAVGDGVAVATTVGVGAVCDACWPLTTSSVVMPIMLNNTTTAQIAIMRTI